MLLVLGQLDTARVIWEEGVSIKKRSPSNWPEGKPVGHVLDWRLMYKGPAYGGQCPPWQVVLGVQESRPSKPKVASQ